MSFDLSADGAQALVSGDSGLQLRDLTTQEATSLVAAAGGQWVGDDAVVVTPEP